MLSVHANMLAINANRELNINTKKKAKSAEKLASGYKVNRAADDAANLSISEKMRRQIRGLSQGSDNIVEGISLLQVADGALDEVTDMLQRINELSVKAYNGTNTKEDRNYIQAEIDQLLTEIDRVGDTTTYNEIPILKWRNTEVHTVTVTPAQRVAVPMKIEVDCSLPEWLEKGVDEKMEHHSENDGLTQIMNKGMLQMKLADPNDPTQGPLYDANGNIVYEYWGSSTAPPPDFVDSANVHTWTQDMSNNVTAKINFEGLKEFDTVSDLCTGVVDLLARHSWIGVPCGTCTDNYYGVYFTDSANTMGIEDLPDTAYLPDGEGKPPKKRPAVASVDLNAIKFDVTDANGNTTKVNCIERIDLLAKEQEANNTLTEDQKKNQVKQLADEIAKALCKETFDAMNSCTEFEDHFDRSLMKDDYTVVVYDYRDQEALINRADARVETGGWIKAIYPGEMVTPGITGEVQLDNPLWIVCSAQDSDDIPLHLPYIDTEEMHIRDYDVSRYKKTVSYSDAYRKKLEEWENSTYTETIEYEETVPVYKCVVGYVDGERHTFFVKDGEKTQKYTRSSKHYLYDRPEPGPGDIIIQESYEPSNNRNIKDALEYVCTIRSELGAQQNRLEHTFNNNQNKEENATASDSRLRDTDVAEEMMTFSSQSIIEQAGVSMLTQANQYPQLVMSLLQ